LTFARKIQVHHAIRSERGSLDDERGHNGQQDAKTPLEIQEMILERIRELLGISVFLKLLLMSRGDL
jgi:hypothetical protein